VKVRMDQVKPLVFSEDERELRVEYGNRGEPFRDGVEFTFARLDGRTCPIWVLLDRDEVQTLRDKLNEFLASK
jgi:hypothetical protein